MQSDPFGGTSMFSLTSAEALMLEKPVCAMPFTGTPMAPQAWSSANGWTKLAVANTLDRSGS